MNPSRDVNENNRSRKVNKALLAVPAVLMLFAGLWLGGASSFRQAPTRQVTPIAAFTPLAVLNTATEAMARGDADFDRGDFGQALADYTRAIELRPDYAEAYNNRAYTYMTIQDYADALPDLDAAIRIRPDYVNALMNRGDIHNFYYEIDYGRAINDYDHVIAVDPKAVTDTSVCGHRAIAVNGGMTVGLYLRLAVLRTENPCGSVAGR